MAYMSQDKKKQIKVELDKVLKGTGIKYSLGVRHHSSLVLNIWSGPVDFIGNYNATVTNRPAYGYYLDVNCYWYKEHFTGEVRDLLEKVLTVLNTGNHDNSDVQTDYFDVGWYVNINIGKWDKPYQYKPAEPYNDTVPACPMLRAAF